jgi:hypothetical protein
LLSFTEDSGTEPTVLGVAWTLEGQALGTGHGRLVSAENAHLLCLCEREPGRSRVLDLEDREGARPESGVGNSKSKEQNRQKHL